MTLPADEPRRGTVRRLGGAVVRAIGTAYRAVVTHAALLVIALWIGGAIAVQVFIGNQSGVGGLGTLLPAHSKAVQIATVSSQLFKVPVLSETSVVVSNPSGLSSLTRADVVTYALTYDHKSRSKSSDQVGIYAAVPVPTKDSRVAVTYLYFSGSPSPYESVALAHQYAAHFAGDPGVRTYVTGLVPAQASQSDELTSHLDLFAILSVILVAGIVAITFRSVLTPLLVLATALLAYLVSQPLLNLLAKMLGFAMPEQVQPIVVALLLGVVTDYSVLQFSDVRDQMQAGHDHGEAVRRGLRRNGRVISVAALTVVGGTVALLAANLQLFRAFGPAMALTVVVGGIVCLTFTPAAMTLLGRRLFRLRGGLPTHGVGHAGKSRIAAAIVRPLSRLRFAIPALLVVAAALLAAAYPLRNLHLDVSFTDSLPHGVEVREGSAALARSGVAGITGPTEVDIFGVHVTSRRAALKRFQDAVSEQPGVAIVYGPAENPLPKRFGVFLASNGNAARLIVIFKQDPLSAQAITAFNRLNSRLPHLAATAGLRGTQVGVTGQTAIASELADLTRSNLRITLAVAAAVDFVILALYLRALITPILLLVCSALGVAATLGITTWFFQDIRNDGGLTFYVFFATAVLLLALGSDYNVFTVGNIWEDAKRRPLRDALRSAVPRSSRAITAAGLTLAATLAMVAVIPLEPSRQVAFAMALGLLIDTMVVRPILTPTVLTVLGRLAGWPGRRIRSGYTAAQLSASQLASPGATIAEGTAGGSG